MSTLRITCSGHVKIVKNAELISTVKSGEHSEWSIKTAESMFLPGIMGETVIRLKSDSPVQVEEEKSL